jgi:Cleft lip and palate transmembrane protein 1 (CLPTM1)
MIIAEPDLVCQRYDKLAFRYVSYVALPALAIYAVYSLAYETHRGWYSFVISTLTSFVYMFGFVRAKGDCPCRTDLTRAIDCRLS